ncbi:MAG: hypothetical protein KF774_04680 [Planctomyces sp.]|nr:hypothetical protein [Planctomyces sp.]
MSGMLRSLWNDERGFILSAELVIISTVLVIGLVSGLVCIRTALSDEMTDVASAIGSLNQSYSYGGMHGCRSWCGLRSRTYGSAFLDRADSPQELQADFGAYGYEYLRGGAVVVPGPGPGVIIESPCAPGAVIEQGLLMDGGGAAPAFGCPVDPWTPGVPSPGAILNGPRLPGEGSAANGPAAGCPTDVPAHGVLCPPADAVACPTLGTPCDPYPRGPVW